LTFVSAHCRQSARRACRRACQAAIHRGQGGIRRRHKSFSGRGRVPRRCRGFPLTPPKGFCRHRSRPSMRGRGAQARPQPRPSRESINEREFPNVSPRGTFLRGRQFKLTARESRFPRRLNLYSRRQGVNRLLQIALRGQIRVIGRGNRTRRNMKPAHPSGARYHAPGAGTIAPP
jgi:hypothetical protein